MKGTGTINGVPGYGFVAYGADTPDAARLVVWPLSAGQYPQETLLYDNRDKAGYDLDVSDPQPLAGGSPQVHQQCRVGGREDPSRPANQRVGGDLTPRRLTRLETEVLVFRRMIVLLDDEGDYEVSGEEWSVSPNCIVAISAGATDHYASVTVEIWDEPPSLLDGWKGSKAGRVRLDSGYLQIQPTDTHVLRIGPPGHYEVWAYSAGRSRIAALTPRSGIENLRGVESFLFQFWPAGLSRQTARCV
ncbi:hypothetical protein NCC78_01810 [Micromonospora phytophila]|uniref:hypothetical protein n=1 Tax=Micromonospora phytophila TaxID=709888 RepID=UPI00202E739C|nr:hypothetical protein [Micromonospora phytophila]MCM0673462.1 hypothetical protein [Micromonospora phytophila]